MVIKSAVHLLQYVLKSLQVFLDVSKAFDKDLLFKLRQIRIFGTLCDWMEHYLTNRSQNVLVTGISSSLRYLQTGVPQGSILGPFNLYK